MNEGKILAPRRGEKETMETSPKTNIVLAEGEIFIESDTEGGVFRIKVGDGTTTYENLPYAMSGNSYDIKFDPGASGLESTNVDDAIKEIKEDIDMFTANGLYYGSCTTAAATAAKEVTIINEGFGLSVGTVVTVKFTNTNTASNCTLNVNSTGAKPIYFDSSVYTGSDEEICGKADKNITYTYDGSNWVCIGGGDGSNVDIWEGTKSQYEQLTPDPDTCYFITPDPVTSQE